MYKEMLKKKKIEQMLKDRADFNEYVYRYNLALADALYCELGMDAEQIQNLFKKVTLTMECINSGNLNINDLKQMCFDELGINFVKSVVK